MGAAGEFFFAVFTVPNDTYVKTCPPPQRKKSVRDGGMVTMQAPKGGRSVTYVFYVQNRGRIPNTNTNHIFGHFFGRFLDIFFWMFFGRFLGLFFERLFRKFFGRFFGHFVWLFCFGRFFLGCFLDSL